MLTLRKADEIYRKEGGWFDARWHFSFAEYRDPEQMGIGPLRVFNDDRLTPGSIWPMHPHTDIEGITYVVEGAFRHQDSEGGGGTFSAGAIQRMTLGSGARHSEQNASEDASVRFIQFWILPHTANLKPELEQRQFHRSEFRGGWKHVIGPAGGDVVKVHQDANVYLTLLDEGESATLEIGPGRGGYLYVMDGLATMEGEELRSGDAVKVEGPETVRLEGFAEAHAILVEVPLEFERVGVWAERG